MGTLIDHGLVDVKPTNILVNLQGQVKLCDVQYYNTCYQNTYDVVWSKRSVSPIARQDFYWLSKLYGARANIPNHVSTQRTRLPIFIGRLVAWHVSL